MKREQKTQLLGDLKKLFDANDVVVISHYQGLTVAAVSQLRNDVRKAGAGFKVTKNRITRLALKDTKFAPLVEMFKGPTAISFASDPVAACKAVVNFSKENEKLVILGGAMGDKLLSVEEVKYLASLPSLDELRAKIVGLLQAPAAKMARVCKAYSEKEAA